MEVISMEKVEMRLKKKTAAFLTRLAKQTKNLSEVDIVNGAILAMKDINMESVLLDCRKKAKKAINKRPSKKV